MINLLWLKSFRRSYELRRLFWLFLRFSLLFINILELILWIIFWLLGVLVSKRVLIRVLVIFWLVLLLKFRIVVKSISCCVVNWCFGFIIEYSIIKFWFYKNWKVRIVEFYEYEIIYFIVCGSIVRFVKYLKYV